MHVTADPKTGRMMVLMQKLMGVANVYKPGEEQVRLEATRQTQRYGIGSGTNMASGSREDAQKDTSTEK